MKQPGEAEAAGRLLNRLLVSAAQVGARRDAARRGGRGLAGRSVSTGVGLMLLLAVGCGAGGLISGSGSSVTGTVTYRERIALTPEAELIVQVRDTSLLDVASKLIAEQVIPDPGQVPIKFEVEYDPDVIDPRNTYSVSARIVESGDRLAFINDTAHDVITRDNPERVDIVLVLVEPPPE